MDPLTIFQLAVQYGPMIKAAIDEAWTNDDLGTKLRKILSNTPLISTLEQAGSKLFPQAASALHLVAGAIAAFDPNTTKWLQGVLNTVVKPSPNLEVDGIYGRRTAAAVTAFQQQAGLKVDGFAGAVTQAALQVLLGKQSAPKSA
jgi:peptidoglycan hydrolase-like protein with peptidoglycan-binding domain